MVTIALTFIVAILVAPLLAHLYWRLRYGPPSPDQIPILAYHKVDPRFELGGTRTTPRQFARQMRFLADNGYQTVTLSQAATLMNEGRSGERKYVCLTFDDAYESLYFHAWPVLKQHGFTATIFAVADFVGAENTWDINWLGLRFRHMSWEQMREMRAAGIEFGSHGASHWDLRYLSDAELDREVRGSKQILEQGLGAPVTTFSYPFGRDDDRVKRAVEQAGYAAACSLSPRPRNSETNYFALRRCGVYITDVLWDFRHKVDQRSPWFWIEDLFSRGVNFCAGGTALAKRIRGYRRNTDH
ncbi:MAG: polysaccharide deacetylase family protein [Candidatus Edwardsbacteria bacterium]|nr:polysaccharide deacetylase family protein [Candidatus Edwardsbacteria bacterium]